MILVKHPEIGRPEIGATVALNKAYEKTVAWYRYKSTETVNPINDNALSCFEGDTRTGKKYTKEKKN